MGNEIRITSTGRTRNYVTYAAKLLKDEETFESLTLRATGTALATAVTVSEIIKRRFKGLHQVCKIGNAEVIDTYEPLEEGLEVVEDVRSISFIEITLSLKEPNPKPVGYQEPLDESLVKEYDEAEDERRKAKKGKGRGKRGKGRGKNRDS